MSDYGHKRSFAAVRMNDGREAGMRLRDVKKYGEIVSGTAG